MKGHSHSSGNSRAPNSSSAQSDNAGDEDGDNDDSNEHEDDDAKQPAGFAPSYGNNRKHRNGDHKAGLGKKQRLSLSKRTGLGKDHRPGLGSGSGPGPGSGFGENCSVSSVSSASDADADNSDEDDDAYRGVDYVSDENDADVEKEEEDWILASEYGRDLEVHAANIRATDEWMGLDDLENRPFYSTGSFFAHDQPLLPSENGDGVGLRDDGGASKTIETPPAPRRRVHFDMSQDSSSDSEKTTDDEYPDFLQQDSLDPDIRRMIENDSEPKARPRPRSPHDLFAGSHFYDVPGSICHVEESETSADNSSEYESKHATPIQSK